MKVNAVNVKGAALLGAALATTALAAGELRLKINGRSVPGTTLSVGGRMYVPVSALTAAGFRVSAAGGVLSVSPASSGTQMSGGSVPLSALEGCLNQTLFNGVWRVKFSNLRLVPGESGARWHIDLEVRNGTARMMTGADGLLLADSGHLAFVNADGAPMGWGTADELGGQKFTFAQHLPSGIWKGTLTNVDGNQASASRRPVRLVWRLTPSEGGDFARALPWGAQDPSFRINLNCTK